MEENLSWKIVYFATLFSLVVLGIAYYLISPRGTENPASTKTDKLVELKNTHIEGRKEGKRLWEFFAKEGWTSNDRRITYLFDVKQGNLFSDGELSVSELTAPQVKVYGNDEMIEAFGQREGKIGPSRLSAYLDLGKFSLAPKDKSQWTRLSADYVKYLPREKKSEIHGHVSLIKRNTVIRADRIDVDHSAKKAMLIGKVKIKRRDGLLNSGVAEYLGQEEQINASGKVELDLASRSVRTLVRCDYATLFNDLEKDIPLRGSLEVVQGKKMAVASDGVYSRQQGGLTLKGNTRTVIEKARALLKQDTAAQLRDPDTKAILKEKTVVTASEIFFSTRTGDARAVGSVEVTQKDREARSDQAIYDDKKETLSLTGNVYMKKKTSAGRMDWVKCRQVLISVPKETFEALGAVEAEFKL